ncbi:MAG: ABC transporter permease [Chthonomonadales bacterium]
MSSIRYVLACLLLSRTRTGVAACCVALASGAALILGAFTRGYEAGVKQEIEWLGAQLIVTPKGCPYDAASMALHGANWPCYLRGDYLGIVRRVRHVEVAAPVLMAVVYGERSGVQDVYCGVDADILRVKRRWRIVGAFPSRCGDVLAGAQVAREHGWKPGTPISLPGLPSVRGRISGILERLDGPDDLFLYVLLADARRWFHKSGRLTHILVRLDQPENADAVASQLRGCDAGLDMNVIPVSRLFESVSGVVTGTRLFLGALAVLAVMCAATGVANAMFMAVSQRTREIGILRSAGATPGQVFALVLGEAWALSLGGCVLGVAGAWAFAAAAEGWLRARLPFAPHTGLVRLDWDVGLGATGAVCLLCIGAALLPAWRAARLSPASAMRDLL